MVIMFSGTVVSYDCSLSQVKPGSTNVLTNSHRACEHIVHVFSEGFNGKHASRAQQSSNFDNRVTTNSLLIFAGMYELSSEEATYPFFIRLLH